MIGRRGGLQPASFAWRGVPKSKHEGDERSVKEIIVLLINNRRGGTARSKYGGST
jgi:hypothetical protein